jgi:hypothetical protein
LKEHVIAQGIQSPPRPFSHYPWILKEACLAAARKEMDRGQDRISSQKKICHCKYVDDVAKEGWKGEDSAEES